MPTKRTSGRTSGGRTSRPSGRTGRRPRPSSRPAPRPTPAPESIPVELGEGGVQETVDRIRTQVMRWANKGRYTKVRFKFRGKQLLPDVPLAAVVAAEGLSFYWAGLLRALVVNVAGGSFLSVELVNESEKVISQGREALLGGDVQRAIELFEKATEMDSDNANAWLNLGVARKLRGEIAAAREALEKARKVGGKKPVAAEADRILETLPS